MDILAKPLEVNQVDSLLDYWYNCSNEYLIGMGADPKKMPDRASFKERLIQQLGLPDEQKAAFATIWYIDGVASGHCNINKIQFGEEAYMHLHLWQNVDRKRGVGTRAIHKSLPFFFNNFKLKTLYCEPYAKNLAPNKTLSKVGFTFLKEYITVPGSINFEQPVKRYAMTAEVYAELLNTKYMES